MKYTSHEKVCKTGEKVKNKKGEIKKDKEGHTFDVVDFYRVNIIGKCVESEDDKVALKPSTEDIGVYPGVGGCTSSYEFSDP